MIVRFQQVAKTSHVGAHKLMKASFVVDESGNLLLWFEPECSKIYPNGAADELAAKLLT